MKNKARQWPQIAFKIIEEALKERISVCKPLQYTLRSECCIFQGTIAQIERKQPEIERVMEEVNNLCQEPFLDEEDREELQQKLNDLRTNWGEVRTEALQKETK